MSAYRIFHVFLLLCGSVAFAIAQPAQLATYEPERQTVRQHLFSNANTASSEAYLSESEKTVVLLCNLARMDGPYFVANYLHLYKDTASAQFKNLKQALLNGRPLPPLRPAFALSKSAAMQAHDMGNSGLQGTESSDGRPFYDRIHQQFPATNTFASNFYLGSGDPLEIVLGLLVGESDTLLQYRNNILSPNIDFVGLSIRPHKLKCSNTVLDFARKPTQLPPVSTSRRHPRSEVYWLDCPKGSKVAAIPRRRNKGFLGLW